MKHRPSIQFLIHILLIGYLSIYYIILPVEVKKEQSLELKYNDVWDDFGGALYFDDSMFLTQYKDQDIRFRIVVHETNQEVLNAWLYDKNKDYPPIFYVSGHYGENYNFEISICAQYSKIITRDIICDTHNVKDNSTTVDLRSYDHNRINKKGNDLINDIQNKIESIIDFVINILDLLLAPSKIIIIRDGKLFDINAFVQDTVNLPEINNVFRMSERIRDEPAQEINPRDKIYLFPNKNHLLIHNIFPRIYTSKESPCDDPSCSLQHQERGDLGIYSTRCFDTT